MTSTEIKNKPTTQVADIVSLTPGIYQSQRGKAVSSGGSRTGGNLYIIDGVQVSGTNGIDMAQSATEQLEVITSGISAKYGDVSGAVINITSRGVAAKFNGSLRLQHSIDGYNNNLGSFSIAGPLLKKTYPDSSKRPVMGFSLSGDFYKDEDRYPAYNKEYVTKSSVLADYLKNPLHITSDNTGQKVYYHSSDFVTFDQMDKVKKPANNVTKEMRLNGKLDYKLSDNLTVTAGGMFNYSTADQYTRARTLFGAQTPNLSSLTTRSYVRLTQKFGKQGGMADTANHSIISNAYYTVQVDYQQTFQKIEDPTFKKDIFKYGYVGRFDKNTTDIYLPNQEDTASHRKGTVLFGTTTTGIDFHRSELNPNLANYTSQYYGSLDDNLPVSINQIQAKNALANGDQPNTTYDMFYSPGTSLTSYSSNVNNQYALSVDASFDLKLGAIKHGIEFGLYYQQRILRAYSASSNLNLGTQSLWQQMRQLVSSTDNGNLKLDKANPIFVVNGQHYTLADVQSGAVIPGPTDTIMYGYTNSTQTPFDKNLRKRLKDRGYNVTNTSNINIDALDPSVFSLDLFSADELLANGNPFVNYYGYTYTGQQQTGTVNFNDFWTKKDENGNYTRPIGAFTPNYIAGYLLDKFEYKNIVFNLGVRVERFSANTKVLKDPYSLYATKTVGQFGAAHPSNIGNDYVVYVDDNTSNSPNVIGYRNGNQWYDYTGKFIEDPSVLKDYSNGRDPQPVLSDPNKSKITDTNFNPNLSFTDYNPQVSVMPRIRIGFPISETSNFFAHYDIYVQRPNPASLGIATAADYYFLNQNSNQIINNSNLRSSKTFDYELGFEQAVGRKSVIKITGFYNERKDMVTVQPYLYAYPTTYYTYGNRDFSTTKGVKLNYELQASNHLSMSLSYTLQFAEGTGSSPYSTNAGGGGQISPQGLLQSFIEAGLPNLRYISGLDVDSRHNIVANIDYRYNKGEGPVVFGNHILQNAGIDIVARTRSGEPYTRLAIPASNTIVGCINGSRIPWHFGMDLKINKDFEYKPGRKNKDANASVTIKPRRTQKLSTFIFVQNLLNTREILSVYGYTGRPDDDGFLSSSYGAQKIPQQVNPQSFVDLYKISNADPNKLNYARTINFGIEYNF